MPSTQTANGMLASPHWIVRDFLDKPTLDGLFEWAVAHEQDFVPTTTGKGENRAVRPDRRVSTRIRDLGPFARTITSRIEDILPAAAAALRTHIPQVSRTELELVAHGDGAFFAPHIDAVIHERADEGGNLRIISSVFYFHREPQGFEGGELRLLPLRSEDPTVVIRPENNSLVLFLSWMPHEVLPVRVPSGAFLDSRFAVNAWVWGRPGSGA